VIKVALYTVFKEKDKYCKKKNKKNFRELLIGYIYTGVSLSLCPCGSLDENTDIPDFHQKCL